jgi:hypothetical protein
MKKSILFIIAVLIISGQLFSQQSYTKALDLQNPTHPSTFLFTDNGYWEETFNDTAYTFFKSQVFSLSHIIEGKGASYGGFAWNGFTVCNSGDNVNHTGDGWSNYQWGCMAGGGIMTDTQGNVLKDENGDVLVQKELPYLVAYWNYVIEPEWWHLGWGNTFVSEPTRSLQILLDDDEEYEAVGVYVAIHPWVYFANLYGDAFSRPLNKEGDFYKLLIHGLNPDRSESGKYVEYMMSNYENEQLIQNEKWEWVDLSSLGKIGGFYFTLSTTDSSAMGANSPVYFCMDKLQVHTKPDGIADAQHATFLQVYPNPTTGELKMENGELKIENVEIYNVMGKKQSLNLSTPQFLNISHLPTGIYFLKIETEQGSVVKKVIKN